MTEPRTAPDLTPVPIKYHTEEALTMLGGAMLMSAKMAKAGTAGMVLDRARLVAGELELLGYAVQPVEAAAPYREALERLVAVSFMSHQAVLDAIPKDHPDPERWWIEQHNAAWDEARALLRREVGPTQPALTPEAVELRDAFNKAIRRREAGE